MAISMKFDLGAMSMSVPNVVHKSISLMGLVATCSSRRNSRRVLKVPVWPFITAICNGVYPSESVESAAWARVVPPSVS